MSKISDKTKQLYDSAQDLLYGIRQQQQAWRGRAAAAKKLEAALQKAAEEAAEAARLAQQEEEDAEFIPVELPAEAPVEAPVIAEEPVEAPPAAEVPPAVVPQEEAPKKTRTRKKAAAKPEPEQPASAEAAPLPEDEKYSPEEAAGIPEKMEDSAPQTSAEPIGAEEETVKNSTQDNQQTENEAAPKVLDFRTKESRDRAKPQTPRRDGPVYISKPDPSQPAPRSERSERPPRDRNAAQGRTDRPMRDRNAGPRMQDKDKDASSAPRQGSQQRRPGGNRSGGGLASALPPVQEKRGGSNYDPNKSQYNKPRDQEKKGLNRRQQQRMTGDAMNFGEDESYRKKRKGKGKEQAHVIETVRVTHAVMATEMISVKDLSEKIGRPAGEIIKKLFLLGIMATINNEIDFDTAQLVCTEFDVELEQKLEQTAEDQLLSDADAAQDDDSQLVERPPVVTIMGHVDHGKTSLLDRIRKSHVTASEAGGITQHIGAYSIVLDGRQITFLDTPGHEAFTAMRARGAQATDIAVLVVAADDGIMPQTIEAINHAKAAGVAVIVAINKIDRPAANVDRVLQQLTEYNLVPEEWGGDTICVPVSAHTGENVDRLLEMILLQADVLELRANPDRKANGIIIEARLDKGRGPVATVLVKNGTLHVGDTIVAGTAYGRVRAMQNDKGERVESAGPADPVEVIGFSDVPEAGDNIYAVEEGSFSRQVAEERRDRQKAEQIKAMSKVSLDDLFSQIEQGNIKDLNIIVKADVQGSVEAVRQSLEKISNDEVRVRTIHGGVGAITATDVMLASASNAIIVGFNVRPQPQAKEAAEQEKVDIRLYRVIYQAIEDIEAAIHGMLAPVFEEKIIGKVEVREVIHISKVGSIAGCYVTDGKVTRNSRIRLIRDGVVLRECDIASLRRFKDDVREVASGYECGISLQSFNDIKEGDQFEVFENVQVEA